MGSSRRTVALWALAIPLAVFLLLAASVPRSGALTWEDSLLRRLGSAVEHGLLIRVADVGLFGATLATIVASAFIAGVLVGRGRHRHAAVVIGALLVAVVAERGLKEAVHREPFHRGDGYSFPSGGAMFSAILLAALYLAAETPTQRRLAVGLGLAVMVGLGAGLVLFGWHYPSDVVAGWCATAVLVAGVWLLAERAGRS